MLASIVKIALLGAVFAAADGALLACWDDIRARLGALFGLELGVVIFLHGLAGLLVLDWLDDLGLGERAGRALAAYQRLPAGPAVAPAPAGGGDAADGAHGAAPGSGRRCRRAAAAVLLGAAAFWGLETLVLPFLPVPVRLPALAAALALAPALAARSARPARRRRRALGGAVPPGAPLPTS